uniref:Eukaryotic translation initiation factor 3 subunit F n=2 Tax=Macrostomum lignano TaxID=282301 RepID=A0A1I8HHL5_9PLAT
LFQAKVSSSSGALQLRVHPTVLLQIIDFYERRPENQLQVIGTLLGSSDSKGQVTATNCFSVPHSESEDSAAIDIEFQRAMFELHRKANPGESIVGWFSTGSSIRAPSVLIHDYYSRECRRPVHMLVNAEVDDSRPRMQFRAFVSTTFGVPGKTKGTMFVPIELRNEAYDDEAAACRVMQSGRNNIKRAVSLLDDVGNVRSAARNLSRMLEQVIAYVDSVLTDQQKADPQLGRSLAQLVNTVPKLDKETFDDMVNSSTKDLLMLSYLTTMIRTHLDFNEKLIAM